MPDNQHPAARPHAAQGQPGLSAPGAPIPWRHYAIALGATVLTLLIDIAINRTEAETLLEIYMIPVFISAYLGGLGPGLLAAGASGLATNYLLIPPVGTLWIESEHDLAEWLVLLLLSALISAICERLLGAQRRAEAARQEVEERFHLIVEEAQEYALLQITPDGRVASWNAGAQRLNGYRANEIIGQPITRFYRPEELDLGVPDQLLRTAAAHGSVKDAGWRVRNDGTQFWGEVIITALRGADGRLVGFSKLTRDMTDSQRSAAILRESEERFSKAFQANPAAMVITQRADGRVVDVNQSYIDLLGYSRTELINNTGLSLSIFDRADERQEVIRQLQTQGFVRDYETVLRTRAGDQRDVRISLEQIDLSGVACILSIFFDITNTKRAEQQQRATTTRLQVLADVSRAYAEVGPEYQALLDRVARATTAGLGDGCTIRLLSDDQRWLDLVALYDVDPERLAIHRAALQDTPMPIDGQSINTSVFLSRAPRLIATISDGQAPVGVRPEYVSLLNRLRIHSIIAAPMLVQGQATGVIFIYRHRADRPAFTETDLNLAQDLADRAALAISNAQLLRQVQHELGERSRAEAEVRALGVALEQRVIERTAELAAANQELAAANRELEAFSYSISHDLRAPLRAIDGFSRILLEDYIGDLPEEAQRYFQLVRNNAQQMGRLVDDLLAFSRLSRLPLTRREVDPGDLVQQCIAELHGDQEGREITIQVEGLPPCQADPALLKQVWINLIANALKYTRARPHATITIGSLTQGDDKIYMIRDNGVGFDMRYASKLFGVFQRMHRAEEYEGTGVGLAIVHRIITRHGGRVWADAAVDQGATFYFTIGGETP